MIQSMTGYGKAVVAYNKKKISVEIKSLNSKTLDLSTRIAPVYRDKEMEIRRMISQSLVRGKVDFTITVDKDADADAAVFNASVIENYYHQMRDICMKTGIPEPQEWLPMLVRMPDVTVKSDGEEPDDDEWAAVNRAVGEAVDRLVEFRCQEGEALKHKFEEKISNISDLLAAVEPFETSRVEKIRQRIIEGLKTIPEAEYDKNRLEQELIYYIEKLDISEEKQRLANHLRYFLDTMDEPAGQGKKLGFIAQEMGREINTTGSKSNNAEMQNIVVRMKDELEQIKEQVLNVL